MTEEWLREKLENLKVKENRLSTLEEINERFNSFFHLDANVVNCLLSSSEIYDCLDDDDEGNDGAAKFTLTNLAIDILTLCMENLKLSPNDLQNGLPRPLRGALLHKQPRIKALALNAIMRELNNIKENFTCDTISMELLNHILIAVQEKKTEVGMPALVILCSVLECHLDNFDIKTTLLEALKRCDEVKCRIYELAVNLGKRSAATLEKVNFILDHALAELDNDDILLQVNILEILESLAEQNHGLLYLEKRKVFDVLGKRIEEMEQNALDRLLIPGIMKFFGIVSSVQPQKIISGYPNMLRCLFERLNSGDIFQPPAFDVLANITHTTQGVLLLEENYATAMKDAFESCAAYLHNLQTGFKIRVFHSLQRIFAFETLVPPEVSTTLERWFSYLNNGSDNMQFLMDFCLTPFPDIKIAALNVISSVCLYPWGIETLKKTAGFLEYLLDRRVEFDTAAKHAKFCVVKILADSSAFDAQTSILLRTHVNEGAFFEESIMDVAIEGNE